jgi:hypothetical protein
VTNEAKPLKIAAIHDWMTASELDHVPSLREHLETETLQIDQDTKDAHTGFMACKHAALTRRPSMAENGTMQSLHAVVAEQARSLSTRNTHGMGTCRTKESRAK